MSAVGGSTFRLPFFFLGQTKLITWNIGRFQLVSHRQQKKMLYKTKYIIVSIVFIMYYVLNVTVSFHETWIKG